MKYSTVEIKPRACKPGEWWVTFSDLPYDRVEGDGSLSSIGFFHYPRRIGKKAAFEKLKAHLISKHQEEVNRLLRSIESLRRVEMPNARLSGGSRLSA